MKATIDRSSKRWSSCLKSLCAHYITDVHTNLRCCDTTKINNSGCSGNFWTGTWLIGTNGGKVAHASLFVNYCTTITMLAIRYHYQPWSPVIRAGNFDYSRMSFMASDARFASEAIKHKRLSYAKFVITLQTIYKLAFRSSMLHILRLIRSFIVPVCLHSIHVPTCPSRQNRGHEINKQKWNWKLVA
jgi:hypothetical protein